ncbi:hypothetical protein [Streptomyces sp. 35G-GA-8]|uniref:hypothetical protein n=1 Tax=Streptomyces sp. 35G-GA-8 TaxID=2939434 RepID=UPI00201F0A06|nr:hypothetical protein [Streptomyces sp. 35G-GA-8]MCL7380097.1 hypothetical protein [Streptomyces sp. 35G-GA-8]
MTETDGKKRRPRQLGELTDVHDFLEEVRLRPNMWVRGSSLQHLDSMLTGYRIALGVHDTAEPFDFWNPGRTGRFSEWLCQRLSRQSSLGWATEIEREAEQAGIPAMEMFFEFLDEFRAAHKQLPGEPELDSHSAAEPQQPLATD